MPLPLAFATPRKGKNLYSIIEDDEGISGGEDDALKLLKSKASSGKKDLCIISLVVLLTEKKRR